MKVIFIKPFTDTNGIAYRPGTVLDVPDDVAKKLLDDGVVRERREKRGPDETKPNREKKRPT